MGTSEMFRQPDKMLESNLQWTSIPSRGVGGNNTPSQFMVEKPDLCIISQLSLRDFTFYYMII